MRKARFKKRTLLPDNKYHSTLVSQLINYLMRDGKKDLATKLVYKALEKIEKKTKKDALDVLQQAVKNASPLLEVKSKRIGGATYQVPMEVKADRRITLALRWILEASRGRQGKNIDDFLAQEILDAYKNTGAAIQKRENTHKAAQANKAFAHFARF